MIESSHFNIPDTQSSRRTHQTARNSGIATSNARLVFVNMAAAAEAIAAIRMARRKLFGTVPVGENTQRSGRKVLRAQSKARHMEQYYPKTVEWHKVRRGLWAHACCQDRPWWLCCTVHALAIVVWWCSAALASPRMRPRHVPFVLCVCLLQFKEYVWVDREFLVEREKENARLGIVKRSRGDGRGKRGLQ